MESDEKKWITPFISSAGQGFIFSYNLSAVSCLHHSVFSAPQGFKIHDFFTRFPRQAMDSSVQMASWSVVSTALDPLIDPHFESRWIRNLISGAATGAIFEIRNGLGSMVTGAYSGAMQSLSMSVLNFFLHKFAQPVQHFTSERKVKKFREKRAEVFQPPISALLEAFTQKK